MNILQIHFASACGREIFQRRTFAKRLAFHEYLLLRVKLWVRIILGHPVWSNLNWNSFIYPWRIYKSIMLHLVEGKFSRKELLLSLVKRKMEDSGNDKGDCVHWKRVEGNSRIQLQNELPECQTPGTIWSSTPSTSRHQHHAGCKEAEDSYQISSRRLPDSWEACSRST